eukprot:jgi/Bigna1/78613/fgenesh1_pg.56_\
MAESEGAARVKDEEWGGGCGYRDEGMEGECSVGKSEEMQGDSWEYSSFANPSYYTAEDDFLSDGTGRSRIEDSAKQEAVAPAVSTRKGSRMSPSMNNDNISGIDGAEIPMASATNANFGIVVYKNSPSDKRNNGKRGALKAARQGCWLPEKETNMMVTLFACAVLLFAGCATQMQKATARGHHNQAMMNTDSFLPGDEGAQPILLATAAQVHGKTGNGVPLHDEESRYRGYGPSAHGFRSEEGDMHSAVPLKARNDVGAVMFKIHAHVHATIPHRQETREEALHTMNATRAVRGRQASSASTRGRARAGSTANRPQQQQQLSQETRGKQQQKHLEALA